MFLNFIIVTLNMHYMLGLPEEEAQKERAKIQ
jgi:hypothetical protein